jgi:EAL domain-containing protein (putative c-di-GMP-specific phosphodiesterase class I)
MPQTEQVRELGCRLGQGYFFSKPVAPTTSSGCCSAHGSLTAR